MRPLLVVLAIVLECLTARSASAGYDGYCLAMSVSEGQNTCGHRITVALINQSGRYGIWYLEPGESYDFAGDRILFVCGGNVTYSGGRPVGCQ